MADAALSSSAPAEAEGEMTPVELLLGFALPVAVGSFDESQLETMEIEV